MRDAVETGNRRYPISKFLFVACGAWLIGLGLYFVFLRPALLPEDLRYIGTEPDEIQPVIAGLARWARRVFTVMGGFMMGAGVFTIHLATSASVGQEKRTWIVLALGGLLTVGTMSMANFQLDSDFKWLLLIPSLLWFAGLLSYRHQQK